jgi:hypothetical protein
LTNGTHVLLGVDHRTPSPRGASAWTARSADPGVRSLNDDAERRGASAFACFEVVVSGKTKQYFSAIEAPVRPSQFWLRTV